MGAEYVYVIYLSIECISKFRHIKDFDQEPH